MKNWLKHFFVPHHGNGHRPHVLRTPAIRIFLALVILIEAIFLLRVFNILPNGSSFASVLASAMVVETNSDRELQHLPELVINPLLEEAARQKARDMAEKGYFSHIGPDGEQPWKWLTGVGYYYLSAGENLAINFTDSKDVTDAWMNSPAHRANMLNGNFTEIGIGTAEGFYKGKQTTFVVQFFGKPYKSPAGRFAEASSSSAPLVSPVAPLAPKTKKVLATPKKIVLPVVTSSSSVLKAPASTSPISTLEPWVSAKPIAPTATNSVVVLGTETKVLEGNIIKGEPTMLGFFMINPRKTTMFAVLFFAVLVAIGLVLTLVFRKKSIHRDLITNALAFLALILCGLVINDYFSTKDILLS
jgi:hypothetical protein